MLPCDGRLNPFPDDFYVVHKKRPLNFLDKKKLNEKENIEIDVPSRFIVN